MTISSMKEGEINAVQENTSAERKGNVNRSQSSIVTDLVIDPDVEQVFNDAAKRKAKKGNK